MQQQSVFEYLPSLMSVLIVVLLSTVEGSDQL